MSIIAMVIAGVIWFVRKKAKGRLSPTANYVIYLVFLIALVFPVSTPSRISIYNLVDISEVKYETNEKVNNMIKLWRESDENMEMEENTRSYITENINRIERKYIGIIFAYLHFIIACLLFAKTMFSYIALNLKVGRHTVEDERINLILERCKQRLRIKRKIRIVKQDLMKSPSTLGVLDVKILVTDLVLKLDDIQISDIFMHELSHYKRKDNVVNFVILILKCVYWFNPVVKHMFKNIRTEMEYATDEMAIDKMNLKEQSIYCKLVVLFSGMSTLEKEEVLGLNSKFQIIDERIEIIAKKKQFEKNVVKIVVATLLIILFMCFVLYPSSYGLSKTPQLYLRLENGEKIRITENNGEICEIQLTPDSSVDLIVKAGKVSGYIFYQKMDLRTMEFDETVNMASKKLSYFECGEYIYKFTLPYGYNQSVDYAIKVIIK